MCVRHAPHSAGSGTSRVLNQVVEQAACPFANGDDDLRPPVRQLPAENGCPSGGRRQQRFGGLLVVLLHERRGLDDVRDVAPSTPRRRGTRPVLEPVLPEHPAKEKMALAHRPLKLRRWVGIRNLLDLSETRVLGHEPDQSEDVSKVACDPPVLRSVVGEPAAGASVHATDADSQPVVELVPELVFIVEDHTAWLSHGSSVAARDSQSIAAAPASLLIQRLS